jgi:hypothetical protein
MNRSPVFKGHLNLLNADVQGSSKTLDLPYLSRVTDAYAITINNSETGNVPFTCKIYNEEIFSNSDGSNSFTEWVELATINLDSNDKGTLLLNGLFIGEGAKMIFTLSDSPTADYKVYVTIREVL